jgi:hypothetical protein
VLAGSGWKNVIRTTITRRGGGLSTSCCTFDTFLQFCSSKKGENLLSGLDLSDTMLLCRARRQLWGVVKLSRKIHTIFCGVTPLSPAEIRRRFGRTHLLPSSGPKILSSKNPAREGDKQISSDVGNRVRWDKQRNSMRFLIRSGFRYVICSISRLLLLVTCLCYFPAVKMVKIYFLKRR